MRRTAIAACLALAASVLLTAADAAPKLVVLIVVDQMRADYIERFKDNWSSGLKRLVDEGAWFTRAAYPYLTTVTCAGHATLSTGAYPHVHGIIANTWFERGRSAVVPCTDDQSARAVPYGRRGNSRTGPANLKAPSLADEMRGRGAQVVTLALKARSAIMLAGHGGTAVTWISETLDAWETSTAFASAPVPQVQEYVTAHPLEADFGKTWDRSLPASQYRDTDQGMGEDPNRGWTISFPHVLKGESGRPDTAYYEQWQHSPFADAYVARMAAALTASMQLGGHDVADFLGVSFSSPDLVGHSFGPRSQEVQDMYANLDRSIGGLLNELDRLVGPGAYVVAFSSDHGVTDIPEQLREAGRDGGRISASAILNAGESKAESELGLGRYLSRINGNEVYFEPGQYERLKREPKVLKAMIDAMSKQAGIDRIYTSDDIARGANSSDRHLRAAALGYVPGRSGDLVISPRAGWMMTGAGTTHGSASNDDQRVPLILFGAGIKPGRYDTPASPADVAPTLAAIAGIPLPKAEGRSLKEALR
jgi:predicted AlkP superfamily pyrophosphatase or phosphodiesterase